MSGFDTILESSRLLRESSRRLRELLDQALIDLRKANELLADLLAERNELASLLDSIQTAGDQ